MADIAFFAKPTPISIGQIVELTGARPRLGDDLGRLIDGAATLERAGPTDISFADSAHYLAQAATSGAGACFCHDKNVDGVPSGTIALVTGDPHRAYTLVLARLYPAAMRPGLMTGAEGISPKAVIASTARIETGVTVEAGAVIGPAAEVGSGTIIGPNAIIGPSVRVGRDCSIGAGSTILHALVGDRVITHPGVHIGQDGFGFIGAADGHIKVPQVGRVLIQDDVEIGSGTTIDRGAIRDTVVGQGTKIDNQVQIAHNVVIGRHCRIAAQVGMAGSATLGDFVLVGGQTGINGHITIGDGAQIAGVSAVYRSVPAGARWGGAPARPVREWLRAQSRELRMGREDLRDGEPKGLADSRSRGGRGSMSGDRDLATLETIDIQRILTLLPHRYPFLMVDRIVEIDGDNSAVGIKNVTVNEPHFLGHFPGRPVMPGVLILEAMAQTAGAICIAAAAGTGQASGVVYLTSIDAAKFRRPVVPGDQVKIRVRKLRQKLNLWRFRAEAEVDGNIVAEAEVSAVMSDSAGDA